MGLRPHLEVLLDKAPPTVKTQNLQNAVEKIK